MFGKSGRHAAASLVVDFSSGRLDVAMFFVSAYRRAKQSRPGIPFLGKELSTIVNFFCTRNVRRKEVVGVGQDSIGLQLARGHK